MMPIFSVRNYANLTFTLILCITTTKANLPPTIYPLNQLLCVWELTLMIHESLLILLRSSLPNIMHYLHLYILIGRWLMSILASVQMSVTISIQNLHQKPHVLISLCWNQIKKTEFITWFGN